MFINPSEVYYEIWQTSKPGIAFFNLKTTMIDVKETEHKKVYEGKSFKPGTREDEEILEDLFEELNINHPADYRARSLSTSDIVVIEGRAYACQNIGWKRVYLENEEEAI